jgi:hypothetical protein
MIVYIPEDWYTADKNVNGIEGNAVSPYGQKLNECKRTAREKTRSTLTENS